MTIKKRFKAEYYQDRNRTEGLERMLEIYKAGNYLLHLNAVTSFIWTTNLHESKIKSIRRTCFCKKYTIILKGEFMNILKEIAKIFITTTLTQKREETKIKLKEKLVTANASEVSKIMAYLAIIDAADGKVIKEINRLIDKI